MDSRPKRSMLQGYVDILIFREDFDWSIFLRPFIKLFDEVIIDFEIPSSGMFKGKLKNPFQEFTDISFGGTSSPVIILMQVDESTEDTVRWGEQTYTEMEDIALLLTELLGRDISGEMEEIPSYRPSRPSPSSRPSSESEERIWVRTSNVDPLTGFNELVSIPRRFLGLKPITERKVDSDFTGFSPMKSSKEEETYSAPQKKGKGKKGKKEKSP